MLQWPSAWGGMGLTRGTFWDEKLKARGRARFTQRKDRLIPGGCGEKGGYGTEGHELAGKMGMG